jgi:hypothetical protein
VAHFKELFQHLPEGTEETNKRQVGRPGSIITRVIHVGNVARKIMLEWFHCTVLQSLNTRT